MTKSNAIETVPVQTPVQVDHSPEGLIQLAIQNKVDVGMLERLMNMRRELKQEQAKAAFDEAMAQFQAKCPIIAKAAEVKGKDKTTIRYKYAPLEHIIEQTKALREETGFSHSFDTEVTSTDVKVYCIVRHRGGHVERFSFVAPIDPEAYMNKPQKSASAMTYAKRYAFINAFGITIGGEDNDTQDVAKPKDLANDDQKAEIDRLANQLQLTKDVVVKRIRELYGVSYTQLTVVQADGIIKMLNKKLSEKPASV